MAYEYETLAVEVDAEGIAVVTINRPEVLNAMSNQCWAELGVLAHDVAHDDAVKCVIVTGSGTKAFSAGADIAELAENSAVEMLNFCGQDSMMAIEQCPKPFIAAVNGYALGGGCELAVACDLRIASDNARFGLPEPTLGIIPGAGGTQRVSRLIGMARAKELILLGEVYSAEKAYQAGLVTSVAAQDELLDAAKDMARKMMKRGPLALALGKRVIHTSMSSSEDVGMLTELLAFSLLSGTDDKQEGMAAFLEKRVADFTGK